MISIVLEFDIVKTVILALFELLFILSFASVYMPYKRISGHKVCVIEWAFQELSLILLTILLHD